MYYHKKNAVKKRNKKSAVKKNKANVEGRSHRMCGRGQSAIPIGHGRIYKCGCDYVTVTFQPRFSLESLNAPLQSPLKRKKLKI